MSDKELKQSALLLKKAVPLMMQHKIATTPRNYALWYTYVENTNPKLNKAMDELLQQYGYCAPSASNALYQAHLASPAEHDLDELQFNLETMANELANTVDATLQDSQSFSHSIDKSFSALDTLKLDNNLDALSGDKLVNVLQHLLRESSSIRDATQSFNRQLNSATDEINKLKQQLSEVQKEALIDSLSKLNNRRAYDKDLEMLCGSDMTFSVVLVDLDHFKKLNDDYSHVLGDAVIRAVAKRLNDICRDGVTAYRYGGEEFALLAPNKDIRRARQLAESARLIIEKITIKDKKSGRNVSSITASFGVAERRSGDNPLSVTERADQYLYEAKQLGRNRVMPL